MLCLLEKMQSTDLERKVTHLILYSLEKEKCINSISEFNDNPRQIAQLNQSLVAKKILPEMKKTRAIDII